MVLKSSYASTCRAPLSTILRDFLAKLELRKHLVLSTVLLQCGGTASGTCFPPLEHLASQSSIFVFPSMQMASCSDTLYKAWRTVCFRPSTLPVSRGTSPIPMSSKQ